MTDAELIARLRDEHVSVTGRAADRIEALIVTAALVRGQREKLTVALAETEAKLAKAVEALKMMCEEFRGYDLPYGSKAYSQATAALAEIKSGIATTPYGLEGENRE